MPAAVIFDLGRGGTFGHRPAAEFGPARTPPPPPSPASGWSGRDRRGVRRAQGRLRLRGTPAGRRHVGGRGRGGECHRLAVDPTTGRLWADRAQRRADPPEAERRALAAAYGRRPPSLATTIGVLLTDATLTKAQASRLATIGHDGMARAIAIHSMMDGDTVFALASGRRPALDDPRRRWWRSTGCWPWPPMRSPTPAWMRCSPPRAGDGGGRTAIWLSSRTGLRNHRGPRSPYTVGRRRTTTR